MGFYNRINANNTFRVVFFGFTIKTSSFITSRTLERGLCLICHAYAILAVGGSQKGILGGREV
jgi:hypothetical protein